MTPSRPYLIRGLYEWIADNGCTPYIVVNAEEKGVIVPQKYVKNGSITLNISQTATKDLRLGNDAIEFQARFGPKIFNIYAPIPTVTAIYAHETSKGMEFSPADIENYGEEEDGDTGSGETTPPKTKKPHLEIVE